MKKLLSICLLVAIAFTVQAQDAKPTKEETIAYLNKILKMSIGYKTYGVGGPEDKRMEEHQIIDYTFSEFKVENTVNLNKYKDNSSIKDEQTYSNIIWANNTAIKIGDSDDSLYIDNEIVYISLRFSNKLLVDSVSKKTPFFVDFSGFSFFRQGFSHSFHMSKLERRSN